MTETCHEVVDDDSIHPTVSSLDHNDRTEEDISARRHHRYHYDDRRTPTYSLMKQILASSAGSIVCVVVLNPINVIKVRLQSAAFNTTTSTSSSSSSPGNIKPSTLYDTMIVIQRESGMKGFWAGTRMGLIMSVPNTVLYMSTYEQLKMALTSRHHHGLTSTTGSSSSSKDGRASYSLVPALAGALARVISVTIISPLELVRTIQTGK